MKLKITGNPYSANYIKKEILINGSVTESGNYYLHRDSQGSILAITKASDGIVVEKRYFDAWGNLKAMSNAQQQLIIDNPQMDFMDRGYTGHEHLQSVGLINMNARVYDPIVRKFLSADNIVSYPYNTQAYDRYSYVLNNPLLYMDLDGNEPITFTAAVIIGVAVAVFSKAIVNMIQGIPFWYGMGKAATMGAVSAAISFGIGSLATSTFGTAVSMGKAAFEAGLHAVTSGAMSALDGGKFGSGFLSGMMSSLVSSGIQGIGESGARFEGLSMTNVGGMPMAMPQISNLISRNPGLFKAIMLSSGGLTGGLSSTIAGGKFIDGFKQGIITSGLNHVAHMGNDYIQQRETRQQMLSAIKQQDPKFYEILSKLPEFLKANPEILSTMSEDTGFSKEQILRFMDIKSPEGQIIKLAQMKNLGQSAYPKSYVNADLVKTFEGLQTPAYIQGTSFLLAVTVLHEFIHWGRAYNILSSDAPSLSLIHI